MMSRWVHKVYAHVMGFFWLPCPVCKRMFGGHEKPGGALYRGRGVSQLTCSQCKIGWQSPTDLDEAPFTAAQINEIHMRYADG